MFSYPEQTFSLGSGVRILWHDFKSKTMFDIDKFIIRVHERPRIS